jgi:predicted esterase
MPHLLVQRTARYELLGQPSPAVRELWIVCHGYGQLASSFIRHFEPIADPSRLIVAPEALSRFYVDWLPGASRPSDMPMSERKVGASWMTSEDRQSELDDQAAYLGALHTHVLGLLDREQVAVHVLGFSQGVATAARWIARRRLTIERLVLWAGAIPTDLSTSELSMSARRGLTIVYGTRDRFAGADRIAAEERRLVTDGATFVLERFDGGHRMDDDTLRRLVAR